MNKQLIALFILIMIISSSLQAQEIATIGEIYDFEVGDEFHTRSDWGPYMRDNIIITIWEKFLNPNNATLSYVRNVRKEEIDWWNNTTTYFDYIDTISYHHLDSLICYGSIDSVFHDSDEPGKYNGRYVNRQDFTWPPYLYNYDDYIVGCGGPFEYYYDVQSNSWWETHLKYFKKGDEEWGEQLVIVGTPEIINTANKPDIFPNPASDFIRISFNHFKANGTVQILNSSWQCALETELYQNDQIIDISGLIPGIYLVVLRNEDTMKVGKLFVR